MDAASEPSANGRQISLDLWLTLALTAFVLLAFGGVMNHEFVHFDDARNIYSNPNVSGLNAATIQWLLTDTSYAPRYMPLGWLCYAVDRQLFALNPVGWHLGNLLLHLINTLLLFHLLKTLARQAVRGMAETEKVASWCAAVGALVWAVNPLRVETVAWASSRIFEMAFFWTLLWILAWLRGLDATTVRQRRVWEWLALGTFTASLLTYPIALFAPVLLLALDYLPLQRAPAGWQGWFQRAAWPLWREKIPFIIVSATVLAITFSVRLASTDQFRPTTLAEFGLLERLMQAAYVVTYYAWKPWAPYNLAATYPTLHAFNPLAWSFLLCAGWVAGMTAAAVWCFRRWPAFLAFWVCHLLILVPFLGLSEYPHSTYDRYSYLHGILWSLLITLGLCALWRSRAERLLWITVLVFISAWFAWCSRQQVPVWRNTLSLYQHITARFGSHPGRGRFDEVLGGVYLHAGRTNDAIVSFERAAYFDARRRDRQIYNEGTVTRSEQMLAQIAMQQDNLPAAVKHYQAALADETYPRFWALNVLRLNFCLAKLGRRAEALPWLKKASALFPDDPEIQRQLKLAQAAQP